MDQYIHQDDSGENSKQLLTIPRGNSLPVAAFSPDYLSIAYMYWDGHDYEIYIMDRLGNNQQKLTDNDIYDGSPVWSPDGTKIAYYIDNSGGIWVADLDTWIQTKINSFGTALRWFPDGEKILFLEPGVMVDGEGTEGVYSIDADGNNVQRLFAIASGSFNDYLSPSFSGDGSKFAFAAGYAEESPGCERVYVMDPDGQNCQAITSTVGINYVNVQWLGDSLKILYVRNYKIYMIDADGSNNKRLTSTGSDIVEWFWME